MSDLIREIDEEVAKDRTEAFWQRWALPIGLFLLVLIGGLFLFTTWQARAANQALACADSFEAAVASLSLNPLEAEAQFSALTNDCGGFNQLAAFKRGDALLAQGQEAEALAAWQTFADDSANQENLRNLAISKIAWHGSGILDAAAIDQAISHLETLPAYTFYTPVYRALAALEAGDMTRAEDLLQGVLNDENTPQLSREYALAILGLINDL